MATYNSFSLPFNQPVTMKANIVYALIAQPADLTTAGSVTFSPTYGGTYNPLSAPSFVQGGFVKSAVDTVVTVTRKSFKQLTSPFQDYAALIYKDRPSYYWSLNETSGLVAVDQIGGANGTISGGVTLNQSGAVGKGMTFDGVSGTRIQTTAPTPAICSIEMWIKFSTITPTRYFFSTRSASPSGDWVIIGVNSGTGTILGYFPGIFNGTKVLTVGDWNHVVCVLNGSTAIVYVNGQLDASSSQVRNTPTGGVATIGVDIQQLNSGWHGTIDEVAIYPYALTASQIQAHYIAKSVPPNSYASLIMGDNPSNYWQLDEEAGLVAADIKGGKNGTISGGVTLNQVGIGKSMKFDGVNGQIVTTTNFIFPSTFTIEAWVNYANVAGYKALLGWNNSAQMQFGLDSSNRMFFRTAVDTIGNSVLSLGTWHYITYVVNGTNVSFYVDGILDSTKVINITLFIPDLLRIGALAGIGPVNGNIDEVAIYNRALSASEILAHYNARPALPYSDQVIAHGASNYWKLDETSGLTAVDSKAGINATISGGVTINQTGAVSSGKSMLYNGTDGKLVTTGNVTAPLTCSVEAWIKTNFNDPSYKAIFSVRTLTVESILLSTNNGVVYVYCAPTALLSIRTIYDNNWHHVVFVSDGTNGWLYLDGTLDNTSSNLTRVSTSSPAGIGFEPGRAAGYYWNGSLDEVAIYPRMLSANEVLSHYQAR